MAREYDAPDSSAVAQDAVPIEDTRRLILHVADALFARHGYAAVSMNTLVEEISRLRPLTKGSLYYYFADKEVLYLTVLLEKLEQTGQVLAESTTAGDLRACVVALVTTMRRVLPLNFARILADSDEYLGPAARERFEEAGHRHLFGPLIALFERAARDGMLRPSVTPPDAAAALLGLAFSFLAIPFRAAVTTASIEDIIADLLFDGMLVRSG